MTTIGPLDADELQARLRFDYRVAMEMRSPVMNVAAFRNVDDAEERRNPIVNVEEGHLASFYVVDYHVRTLIERGKYSEKTSVLIDLLAGNNYPFTEPGCYVFDSPMPWSPHFWEGHPICLGTMWEEARGNMLLGQLLVHIAKLLNFDEIAHHPGYDGWNRPAIDYWRDVLKGRPITRDLPYPALPLFVHEPAYDRLTQAPEMPPLFVLKAQPAPPPPPPAPEALFRRKSQEVPRTAAALFKVKRPEGQ